MRDPPRSGIKFVSPALVGRFFNTEPPGKPQFQLLTPFSKYCCHSATKLCLTLCNPMDYSMPGFPILHRVCSNSCSLSQWCHPTISSSVIPFSYCLQSFPALGSFPVSQLFAFSFSISPPNEYSGLISFKIDWFDLLALQRTLKSLLQHYSSKASIFQYSAFFMVHLSHPYMTTGKTIAFSIWTFGQQSDVSVF